MHPEQSKNVQYPKPLEQLFREARQTEGEKLDAERDPRKVRTNPNEDLGQRFIVPKPPGAAVHGILPSGNRRMTPYVNTDRGVTGVPDLSPPGMRDHEQDEASK